VGRGEIIRGFRRFLRTLFVLSIKMGGRSIALI
jgi:hypothetical protein